MLLKNNPGALQQGSEPADLFGFKINYNTVDGNVNAANKLYNGNIAETFWSTATDGGFVRNYGYKYDQLNRLKDANYQKSNVVTNMYNENLTYDKNGNIMTLKRNGDRDVQTGTIGIDNLSYGYATNSNKLMSVVDNTNNTSGFNDFNKSGNDYAYDVNGNMTLDKNKKITAITYNHLNLPTKIVFGTTGSISYVYSATGQKVEKMVTQGTTITTTNYLNGYLYKNGVLQYFPTLEGYLEPNGSTFRYVFQHKDHLGNIRLSYTKNPTTNALDIIEENNFYPFGLRHAGYNTTIVGGVTEAQKIKFGSKEYQNELNLNVYDFGARVYNPEGGPAFWQIDPKAEQMRRWSPYSYAFNNPIYFIDPDGMAPTDWIEFTGKNGQQQIVYDSSIKTKAQAEAAGYTNVKQVFEAGKGKSEKTGEVINFQKDGNYSVNGGKLLNVDDTSYTTKGGTYIGENKGITDAIGDFGPEALQKGGDVIMKSAGVAALSGAEPVAAILATLGSTMSTIGAGGKIINDAVEGKFDLKNAAIQVGSELLNRYFKKISGDDMVKRIMLENGINEVGKGMEELNKK